MLFCLFLISIVNGQSSVPSTQRNALEALLIAFGANQNSAENFVDQNAKSNCFQGVVCTVVGGFRTISEIHLSTITSNLMMFPPLGNVTVSIGVSFAKILANFPDLKVLDLLSNKIQIVPSLMSTFAPTLNECSLFSSEDFRSVNYVPCCSPKYMTNVTLQSSICYKSFMSQLVANTGLSSCESCCGNGRQDADETGVDCGGGCSAAINCDPQWCHNGVRDNDEIGIDCGGSCQLQDCCKNGFKDNSVNGFQESEIDCYNQGSVVPLNVTCQQCQKNCNGGGAACAVDGVQCQKPKCSDASSICLWKDCNQMGTGVAVCGDRMSGWQSDGTCRFLSPVFACRPSQTSCFQSTASATANDCLGISTPSDNVIARCDVECRRASSCVGGNSISMSNANVATLCRTSGSCGTNGGQCTSEGRCVTMTNCTEPCAEPDLLLGGCKGSCLSFPCSKQCQGNNSSCDNAVSPRMELGACYRFTSAIGSLCVNRSSCQNVTCGGAEIRFLSCADQRCARTTCPFSTLRTSTSQYLLSEICFVAGEVANCDVGFGCNSIGDCVVLSSTTNSNSATTVGNTSSGLSSSPSSSSTLSSTQISPLTTLVGQTTLLSSGKNSTLVATTTVTTNQFIKNTTLSSTKTTEELKSSSGKTDAIDSRTATMSNSVALSSNTSSVVLPTSSTATNNNNNNNSTTNSNLLPDKKSSKIGDSFDWIPYVVVAIVVVCLLAIILAIVSYRRRKQRHEDENLQKKSSHVETPYFGTEEQTPLPPESIYASVDALGTNVKQMYGSAPVLNTQSTSSSTDVEVTPNSSKMKSIVVVYDKVPE